MMKAYPNNLNQSVVVKLNSAFNCLNLKLTLAQIVFSA